MAEPLSRSFASASWRAAHRPSAPSYLALVAVVLAPGDTSAEAPAPGRRGGVVAQSQSGSFGEGQKEKDLSRNTGPMTWPWKLMCAILYILPMCDASGISIYFIDRFPAFGWVFDFTRTSCIARRRACALPFSLHSSLLSACGAPPIAATATHRLPCRLYGSSSSMPRALLLAGLCTTTLALRTLSPLVAFCCAHQRPPLSAPLPATSCHIRQQRQQQFQQQQQHTTTNYAGDDDDDTRNAEPFEGLFYMNQYGPLIIFFASYLLLVRNKRFPHVARFHVMMVSGGPVRAESASWPHRTLDLSSKELVETSLRCFAAITLRATDAACAHACA